MRLEGAEFGLLTRPQQPIEKPKPDNGGRRAKNFQGGVALVQEIEYRGPEALLRMGQDPIPFRFPKTEFEKLQATTSPPDPGDGLRTLPQRRELRTTRGTNGSLRRSINVPRRPLEGNGEVGVKDLATRQPNEGF